MSQSRPVHPMRPSAVHRSLERLAPQLGQTDRERMSVLARLMADDGRIPLGRALDALYPRADRELALASFRQLRARLSHAARETGFALTLDVDSQKRSAPEARWCWFGGDDPARISIGEYSGEEAALLSTNTPITQEGLVASELRDGKPVIRYFVSYAHKDDHLKTDLLRRLGVRLATSRAFSFVGWDDGDIVIGDDWSVRIQQAIQRCHLGLLLVSYDFFNSKYIINHELPQFVTSGRPIGWRRAVPVGLRAVSLDGAVDLKGLEALQIFRDREGKFFSERSSEQTKDRFAEELFHGILTVARGHILQPTDANSVTTRRPRLRTADAVATHQRGDLWGDVERSRLVAPEGVAANLDKLQDEVRTVGSAGERRDAVEFLLEWARDRTSPPFCALLGESGIGKTTSCKILTQALLEAREHDPRVPLPIYLDLRHLNEAAKTNPDIDTILATVIARSWRVSPGAMRIEPEDVRRLVADDGALAIFDGLDEVLVHLTPAEGQLFTRELWRILPAARLARRPAPPAGAATRVAGKLLLSCRTHYFRTVREQQTHLTGEDRDGPTARDYRALVLLPFRPEQIEQYLGAIIPTDELPRVLELIDSIHNLPELAQRPYTLSLIAEQLPNLERWRAEGRRITGVTLYRHVVASWLERDQGKHQIRPAHKQLLMEHLAAALWRSNNRSWDVEILEQWLIDFLVEHPRIAAHYTTKDREVLKEDLRTATFVVRRGPSSFQFAHTSLQEFFLASYLWRALIESRPADWDMRRPSDETLAFLGQLLEEDSREALTTLRAIRDAYHKGRSEMALLYGLPAHRHGWPAHALANSQLRGADLRDWGLDFSSSAGLSLEGCDFSGARLDDIAFRGTTLSGANFAGACLDRAEFINSRLREASFEGASLIGTLFRECDLKGSNLRGATLHRTQFLRCQLPHTATLEGTDKALYAMCEPGPQADRLPAAADARLDVFTGHPNGVNDVAFSPDGTQLVSAGDDGMVRLWDPATGELIRIFRGHDGSVLACALSPDGRRLASASKDGSIRLWDVFTGELVRTMQISDRSVLACMFSPDGKELLAATEDHHVQIRDAATGTMLREVRWHDDEAFAAWSPDGRHVAVRGEGETGAVRFLDLRTGDCWQAFELQQKEGDDPYVGALSEGARYLSATNQYGMMSIWDVAHRNALGFTIDHTGIVSACSFSPDGQHVACGEDDGTLEIWSVTSGRLLSQRGLTEEAVHTCVFSSDGRHLASGHADGAVYVFEIVRNQLRHPRSLQHAAQRVNECTFSPDGQLVSALQDGTLRFVDARTGELLASRHVHEGPAFSCTCSLSGALASGGEDGVVLFDAAGDERLDSDFGYGASAHDCKFSADGRLLATVDAGGAAGIWDVATKELIFGTYTPSPALACYMAPDGQSVAFTREYGVLQMARFRSRWTLQTLKDSGDDIRGCSFSADGRRLTAIDDAGVLRTWDVESETLLQSIRLDTLGIFGVAFSPDGAHVAAGSDDHVIRVWKRDTGELVRAFRRSAQPLRACAFSPDGRRLASSADDTVHMWDATTGERLWIIRWLPDGEHMLLSEDQRLLSVTPNAWRWIGWAARDPMSGELTRFPAETFGPLPLFPARAS